MIAERGNCESESTRSGVDQRLGGVMIIKVDASDEQTLSSRQYFFRSSDAAHFLHNNGPQAGHIYDTGTLRVVTHVSDKYDARVGFYEWVDMRKNLI